MSNHLSDTQIKRMPIAKDKQLTTITSGRLMNAPVAELQLKSFKTDSDGGNWYDVYNEPSEDLKLIMRHLNEVNQSNCQREDQITFMEKNQHHKQQ